ncbi:hypothetical protein [Roseibium aggregatum]|uniref:Uncharacterized protein n=1 Tax=Roseibium aggregatum TaxID=187304 RepID=A0A0M6Y7S0_9HYPH|nr:hypothetical protein [Roseibium aggregatum]CTQ45718.1 hypothetical protein LAL4801_04173 [Roseibium aggregatum]
MSKGIKATLITKGGLGNVVVKHVWLLRHSREKWAQYNSAVKISYVRKGARKARGMVYSYAPYVILIDGWQDIPSQAIFGASKPGNTPNVTVSSARYSSFDEGWSRDFESAIDLSKFKVLADFRDINTYNAEEAYEPVVF